MSHGSPPSHALPLPRYARISVTDDAPRLGRAVAAALVGCGHTVHLLGLKMDASATTPDVLFLTVRADEFDVEPSRLDRVVVVSCATRLVGDDEGFLSRLTLPAA